MGFEIARKRWEAEVVGMGEVEIRGLPDQVLRALEQRAIGHNRSIEAEVAAILIEALVPDIRLGSMLTEIGREVALTDEEMAGFDRDRGPARSSISDLTRPRTTAAWIRLE
ncbi:FitA-like ribbon-helix-helix domain-containing protein [Nocardia carnea]|uniref:FitA-like ribbon-helix-helix domain-containing protein n=1 Tax=Nocardia carnea TaxID=37328 RepID=UPI00030E0225|nr:hypothetical protein [Nocardia carnea]